jgi:GR25 family glycosyltransferase involved in LPS biosynthesis
MWKNIFLACLIPFFFLQSSPYSIHLEKHFKKPRSKSNIHKMKNIDFIYTINLDQRPEKFQHCIDELEPYGIFPYRFSGVNGWELSFESLNSLGVPYESWMDNDLWGTFYKEDDISKLHDEILQIPLKNYYCHCMSRGAIGIVLSHLSVLQDAYDSGFETIWVMEDDIQVIRNPHLISEYIERLDQLVGKDSWDILFTDRDTKNNQGEYVPCTSFAKRPNFSPENTSRFGTRIPISDDFTKIGARYGAYSMIIQRSGMKKILDFIKTHHIFLPYDMEFFLPNDIAMYAVIDDIISFQPGSPSDNSLPNY